VLFGEAVYTQQNPATDFKPITTYYLDPVMKVMEDQQTTSAAVPDAILGAIRTNMDALGYQEVGAGLVNPPDTADVGVHVSLLKGTGAVYYPGYWCDYWTYYGCYYGWSYAGTYRFGSVVLDMGDLRPPPPSQLQVLWGAMVYGVASTTATDIPRAVDGVNRAFAQSQYLDTH
jgi:Domain of unknown function (DUF4136)